MKHKILAIGIILLLTTICLTASVSFTKAAGEGQWITAYTIKDTTTGETLVEFDYATGLNRTLSPVIPGEEIKVEFTINVFASGADSLKLTSGLSKSPSHANGYWELVTEGVDLGSSYNPAASSTSFKWAVGTTFDMILYGKVPTAGAATVSKANNLVTLTSASGGTPIDQITVLVTSSDLVGFNTLYNRQADKLQSLIDSGVSAGYIEIYTNVLNASKTIANAGAVDEAMALLNGLDVANPPASSTMEALFLPIVGVTAAIAVIFVVLFMRTRGKISYFQLVVEDQIKDLEGLTLRASKIDRALSSSLDSVKDRLKRLVGM
jgi:hypothetical protein